MQSCLNCYNSFFEILFQRKCIIIEEDFLRKNEGELAHEFDQISDYNIRARKIRDKKSPGRFYSRIKK